jgi:C-terminal processing protease CtpA/Prc
VSLRREAVVISPVFSTLLTPSVAEEVSGSWRSSDAAPPPAAPPVGYVRLSQFSHNAAEDMRKALSELKVRRIVDTCE